MGNYSWLNFQVINFLTFHNSFTDEEDDDEEVEEEEDEEEDEEEEDDEEDEEEEEEAPKQPIKPVYVKTVILCRYITD